jgi:hypothetical protein
MSHTPGPWTITRGTKERGSLARGIHRPDGATVVRFNGLGRPASREGEANAHLIAAAPDLLEALKALQRAGGMWPDLAPQVLAAIAKAEGK